MRGDKVIIVAADRERRPRLLLRVIKHGRIDTMARDLPSVHAQHQALCRWFIAFGGWRPSEAAVAVTGWSSQKRRKYFRLLRSQGCIEYLPSKDGHTPAGWFPVKDVPKPEELKKEL